jgi:hypothetical protein
MKLANLPKHEGTPLHRRIYAVCWFPFGAIAGLPSRALRAIGRTLDYPAFSSFFGLGFAFLLMMTVRGEASLPLFIAMVILTGLAGLGLTVLLWLLSAIWGSSTAYRRQ